MSQFDERKKYILKELEKNKIVKVSILARELKTSEITIRRDLARLEKEGFLIKTFGGAKLRDFSLNEFTQSKRIKIMAEEKKRIAIYAASMVQPGDVIFIDTGTTPFYVSSALKTKNDITIITNSVLVLTELRFTRNSQLILLGGTYDPATFSLNGPIAEENIKKFRAKYAFIGTDGISISHGVTANSINASQLTKTMMQSAETTILVADHTKVGKVGPIKYAEINDFDYFITDKGISDMDYKSLRATGLQVIKV